MVEVLILEATPKTPRVEFDSTSGKLELRGRSIPENSIEFYKTLNDWIDQYGAAPLNDTVLDIKLEYFNTSSSKCILDLLKKMERLNGESTSVHINWYFEEDDEAMEDAGEDYQAIIKLPFTMIEVEEI